MPRPRLHLIRFDGVLAPHAGLRAAIVPGAVQYDPLMGWGRLAGNDVDNARINCAHNEMLQAEHAPALAGLLNERLAAVEIHA